MQSRSTAKRVLFPTRADEIATLSNREPATIPPDGTPVELREILKLILALGRQSLAHSLALTECGACRRQKECVCRSGMVRVVKIHSVRGVSNSRTDCNDLAIVINIQSSG